jgi:uncharacterized phage-associated protein
MFNAIDVSRYFIAADTEEGITNLKLQKLLYYAQGCFLAAFNKSLFDEEIEAWQHGPVVSEVYHHYKSYGSEHIKLDCLECEFYGKLNSQEKGLLANVQDIYGGYSAWKLRDMSHSDNAWKNHAWSEDKTMPREEIKNEFIDRVTV